MSLNQIYNPRNIPLADVDARRVQLGHLLRLPFRFRVRGIYRFRLEEDGVELILRNSLNVPRGTSVMDLVSQQRTTWSTVTNDLQTDALIVFENSELPRDIVERVKAGDPSKIEFTKSVLSALRFLNEFTVAYLAAGLDAFGMQCPRLLPAEEFLAGGRMHLAIVCPPGDHLTDKEAASLLDLCSAEGGETFAHGELGDLPPNAMEMVPVVFAAQREHVFYEFVVRSRAAMEQDEFQVALLLACVALEAVHAALFHAAMSLPSIGQDKDREELVNNLLREQGFHTLFRVTPILFLNPSERPPAELVEKCKKAVAMRNDIMHAKSRRGKYKMRLHSSGELIEGQAAVLKMVSVFEAALRRRVSMGG